MQKVLLVRGWKERSTWSFPRGKINKDELEVACAAREIYEETGFDCSSYIHENEFIERTIREQRIRLYIITNVPESTIFVTQTRKEIGDIQWFSLNELPGYDTGIVSHQKFYLVTVFISQLKRWIDKFKRQIKKGKSRNGRNIKIVAGYKTGSETDSESNGELLSSSNSKNKKLKEKTLKNAPKGNRDLIALPSSTEEDKRIALLKILKVGSSPLKESNVEKPQSFVGTKTVEIMKRPNASISSGEIMKTPTATISKSMNPLLCFKFDVKKIMLSMEQ